MTQETNPANHHMSLKVSCFPVELSDETSVLANTSFATLWETLNYRTQINDAQCLTHEARRQSMYIVLCAEDISHLLHTNVLLIHLFIFLFHWSISFFRWDTLSYSFLYHQNLTLCLAHSSSLINIVLNSVVVKQVNWFCRKELSFLTPTVWLSFHSSSESHIFYMKN